MHPTGAATVDWELLAATSHYQTAIAIREKLPEQDYGEAMHGVEEFIDALARADTRAIESQLIRVMQPVITWKMQPERRARSWMWTMRNGRTEIRKLPQDTPSLTEPFIREPLWDDCLDSAIGEAEREMNSELPALSLKW